MIPLPDDRFAPRDPPQPISATGLPELSIDKLKFGFEIEPAVLRRSKFDAGCAKLVQEGLLRSAGNSPLELSIPLLCEQTGEQNGARVNATVFVREDDRGHFLANGSIDFNPLRALRYNRAVSSLHVTLDGNDNFIGSTDEFAGIEHACLTLVALAMQAFRSTLVRLFGAETCHPDRTRLWPQEFEGTRDIMMPRARQKAHRLLSSSVQGQLFVDRTIYDGPSGGSVDGGFACIKAGDRQTGGRLKTYAKTSDHLRLEFVLKGRAAVRLETSGWRAPLTPTGAKQLVAEMLELARDPLARFEADVRAICNTESTPIDVTRALAPLIDLADPRGPSVRGPQPCKPTWLEAGEAYDQLMLTHQCVLAANPSARLRRCLDVLVAGGILRRRGRRLCFALSPELSGALARHELV